MAFFLNMSCRKKTLFRTLSRSNNIFKSSQIQNLLMMLIEATMKMVLDKPAILALCHFHFVFYSQTVEGGGSPLYIPNSYRYSHLANFKWRFQTIQLAHKFQHHFDLRSFNSQRHISRCILPALCTKQRPLKTHQGL